MPFKKIPEKKHVTNSTKKKLFEDDNERKNTRI